MSNKAPMRRCWLLVVLSACLPVCLAGCAPKGPSPQLVAEFAKAEALQSEGCYSCLKESLAIFDTLAEAKVPPPGVEEKRFDTALLIAIREKELGIPSEASMRAALDRIVASRLPLLAAADLIIGDATGLDPEMRGFVMGRNRPPLEPDDPKRRVLDAFPATDLAAKYVALAIDCEQQKLI